MIRSCSLLILQEIRGGKSTVTRWTKEPAWALTFAANNPLSAWSKKVALDPFYLCIYFLKTFLLTTGDYTSGDYIPELFSCY